MTVAIILFILFFVLFLGVPIAFGLGTIGLGLMIFGDISNVILRVWKIQELKVHMTFAASKTTNV